MKKVALIILGLALVGCTRNVPVDKSVVEVAKMGCAGFSGEMKDVAVKYWFPTFTTEIVFSCKREGSKTMIVSVSFEGDE